MKNNLIYPVSKMMHCRTILFALFMVALSLNSNNVKAQEESKTSGKLSFSMTLSAMVSDGIRSVKVSVNKKVDGKNVSVDNLKSPINLYLNEVKKHDPNDGTGWITNVMLDRNGEGVFEFPSDFNKLTVGLHEFTFIAKVSTDPIYEDAEEQVTVADAKINLEYNGADSIKTLKATLLEWKDNAYVPVPEKEVVLCVKRSFNFLPFGESGTTTDENGEISGELPLDIPGSANGTLKIAARIDEDDTYGSVEVTKIVPWSVLPKISPPRGRTLWSSGDNAPWLLVISSLTIIIVIWSTIIYLIYLLIKIKRIGKVKP